MTKRKLGPNASFWKRSKAYRTLAPRGTQPCSAHYRSCHAFVTVSATSGIVMDVAVSSSMATCRAAEPSAVSVLEGIIPPSMETNSGDSYTLTDLSSCNASAEDQPVSNVESVSSLYFLTHVFSFWSGVGVSGILKSQFGIGTKPCVPGPCLYHRFEERLCLAVLPHPSCPCFRLFGAFQAFVMPFSYNTSAHPCSGVGLSFGLFRKSMQII